MERFVTDTQPSDKYRIVSRANAGEVMPDPCSPLNATLGMFEAGEKGWRDAYVVTGTFTADEFEPDRTNTISCYGGYMFINMSLTRLYGLRTGLMTPAQVDLQYFGEIAGIPPYEDEARPTDVSPEATERLTAFMARELWAKEDLPELRADAAQTERLVRSRPDFDELSTQELVDHARSFVPLYRRLFNRHIVVSGNSGMGIGTVAGVCAAVGRPDAVMTLVAGLGDVDSAAPSMAMWDLGRLVAASESLTNAFDAGANGLLDRLRADRGKDATRFLDGFDALLARFGSRGPNEWEMRSHTWGTKPALVLSAIDRMRLSPDSAAPSGHQAERKAEADAAAEEIRALVAGDEEAAGQFEAGLRAARLYLAGRERSKTNNIRIVHEMRLALREVGRRLVDAGHLDNVEQVFMFTDEELNEVLREPEAWTDVAREREAQYLALFELEPPFVIVGEPPPLSEWKRRDAATHEVATSGTVLTGIAGCPGVARGRARVVLDPSDPTALEPGDILVAPLTDPAWTPLFVPAAAVVVDVGAQITHAVIVSRELGIPCVVSVTGATKTIPDGAEIEVDGTNGTVTIL
ncbi:MAG: rifampicin phosphotransferase [Actinomycetota bacterium]|nr:rifampicin phosphotransferase [Actinomycetota bacterium]